MLSPFLFPHPFVPSSLCFSSPSFGLPTILTSFHPPPADWNWVLCNASFLFCHRMKSIYPPGTFLSVSPSFPQSPNLPSLSLHALFPWPSSFSETTGELLLTSTDRGSVKRNKRKDRFFLLKPQKLEKKRGPATAQEGITFWTLIIQWDGEERGRERESKRGGSSRVKGREREQSSQGFYSTTSHVYCYLFTASLLCLCLSCPPSECVLFSQLPVIEGGRKQNSN